MGPWGVFLNCHKPILLPLPRATVHLPPSRHFRNHSAKKLQERLSKERRGVGVQGERRGRSFSEMKATPSGFGENFKDNAILFRGTVFLYGTLASLHMR